MTSYSSFRGLGKHTRARQTGFLDSTQNKSEVKKSVWLTGVSLPNPLNDGALTPLIQCKLFRINKMENPSNGPANY